MIDVLSESESKKKMEMKGGEIKEREIKMSVSWRKNTKRGRRGSMASGEMGDRKGRESDRRSA